MKPGESEGADGEVEAPYPQRRQTHDHGDERRHDPCEREAGESAARSSRGAHVMSAPTATNPNWPSDTCPPHPVSTVSESAMIA